MKDPDIVNCDRRSNGRCIVCKIGYVVNQAGGCDVKIPNCNRQINGVCQDCDLNFKLVDGTCVPDVRIPNCLRQNNGIC